MATVLENLYNLRSEMDQRIAKGGVPADVIWRHGEIVYRIGNLPDVLQDGSGHHGDPVFAGTL